MQDALETMADKLRKAAEQRRPLRVRGGGTKDFYGQLLHGELLDTRPLAGIEAYEPSELVVTVGAGTRLLDLQARLAEHGQYLPFEPPAPTRRATGPDYDDQHAYGCSIQPAAGTRHLRWPLPTPDVRCCTANILQHHPVLADQSYHGGPGCEDPPAVRDVKNAR